MSDEQARQFWEVELGYGQAHSEWGEYAQERTGAAGRRLVHAARLLRSRDRYIDEFGEAAYRVMLGDCLWHVYRMIGKLHGVAFLITKPH